MFNTIKATIRRLVDLPWEDLQALFSWSSSGSTIQAENPNLLVTKAINERGEVVAYVTAENILLVDGYVFNPNVRPNDVAIAGDAIDQKLAQHAGVNRFWIVVPPEAPPIGGEKRIRIVERKVYQQGTVPQLNCELKQQIAYLN